MVAVYRTNPGSGDLFATTTIAGEEVQHIKLVTDTGAHAGLSANPLYTQRNLLSLTTSIDTTEAQNKIVKASPGELYRVMLTLASGFASPLWLMAFNATTARTNGAAPDLGTWPVIGGHMYFDWWDEYDRGGSGLVFATGLVLEISSTSNTLTKSGTGKFDVRYV